MHTCQGRNCPIVLSLQMKIKDLEAVVKSGPFPGRPTCGDITKATAAYYGMKPIELLKKTHEWEVSRPRMVAIYLCRILTKASLATIGQHFGGKHHTTVLHAFRRIDKMKYEPRTAMAIRDIGETLNEKIGRRNKPCQMNLI